MKRLFLVLVAALVGGCEHDVLEHDVVVTSNCNGPTRTGRFHFEAHDFDATCASESCGTAIPPEGRQVSGDLEVLHLILNEYRYELTIVPPGRLASEFVYFNPYDRLIWCGWYVDEDFQIADGVGARQDCYFAPEPCWAELEIQP